MFLNLVAPINQLGYGVVGCNVLRALMDQGHTVSYFPIGKPTWDSDLPFVKVAADQAKMYNPDAPSIRIWHQNELSLFPGGGERIGWPIFELNRFDDLERHHLTSVDRLFVCSEWAKSVLVEQGIDKDVERIDVIPLGVDTSLFNVNEAARAKRPYWTRHKTVFLNIGKWEVRKGHNELLEAFCKAFTPEDDVELWMVNDNPFIDMGNEAWKTKYISSSMGANIKIRDRVRSHVELAELYNQVDFGVFPAHAEGWNLEPLELMACGVPSIVTNYSGHTEFCNDTNSLLVEPNGLESAQDGVWFHGQGEWCTFEVDELAGQMREAHKRKQDNAMPYILMGENCKETAAKFSWSNAVKKITEAL